MSRIEFLIVVFTVFIGIQPGKGQFIDVTSAQLGIQNINEGTIYGDGVSFFDFNQDGWDDVTLANGNDVPYFFINVDGQLQLIELGITNDEDKLIIMTLWADYDNDGDSDLLITRDSAPLQLWRNDGNGVFENVAADAGLEQLNLEYWGAAFADYNHDGCLDLCIAKYYHPTFNPGYEYRSILYMNNCDGTFTDVTLQAGFDLPPRTTFQPVFMDYNNDGWEDIFLVIDRIQFRNELFRNNGDGTFTNVTLETGIDISICSMTGTVDDFDNDLDEDIYVTNGPSGNLLMVNYEGSAFVNEAEERGVVLNQLSWGSLWLDYDNNSWLDLYVSVTSPYLPPIGNQLFVNDSGSTFINATEISGFDEDSSQTYMVAMGDLNMDGYYDFVQNNKPPYISKLWQNDGGDFHFLSVDLNGTFSNADGVGSKIHCYAGGHHYYRMTRCGENFTAQNSSREIFGLADAEIVDSLIIEWNRGTVDRYYNLPVDQHLQITEGNSPGMPLELLPEATTNICSGDSLVLTTGIYNSYLWSTGDSTQSIDAWTEGFYRVLVEDADGIYYYSEWVQVDVDSIMLPVTQVNHVTCFDAADGVIQLSLSQPESVDVVWSDSQSGMIRENLSPGIYHYNIQDNNGCTFSDSVEVFSPSPLDVEFQISSPACHGMNNGHVGCIISGGTPPYQIDWNGADTLSLAASIYLCEITDDHQCVSQFSFDVSEPMPITAEVLIQHVSCFGLNDGMIQLSASGGTGMLSIDWGDFTRDSLFAGTYEYIITDSNQCVYAGLVEVHEPDLLNIEYIVTPFHENGSAGSVLLTVTGGTPPYLIEWSTGENDVVFLNGLDEGVYSVLVTDQNGCGNELQYNIDFVAGITEIPSYISITPNPVSDLMYMHCTNCIDPDVGFYDVSGRLIRLMENVTFPCIIDTSDWPEGHCYVVIRDAAIQHVSRLQILHR